MRMKKPSLGGSNYGYLGHFKQDKWIQKGHNDWGSVGKLSISKLSKYRDMALEDHSKNVDSIYGEKMNKEQSKLALKDLENSTTELMKRMPAKGTPVGSLDEDEK
jgi:hypothetical protein